ncbi:MAG: hypothetical protein ABL962_16550 [Fimbriimonadaceae bacterium]
MKTKSKASLILFFVVAALWCGYAQPKNGASLARSPNAKTIAVILNDNRWTIEELNLIAMAHLSKSTKIPASESLQAVVYLYPQNKTNMCEFTYSSGFGKPVWRVKIGYDGKVSDFEQGIMREAPFESGKGRKL